MTKEKRNYLIKKVAERLKIDLSHSYLNNMSDEKLLKLADLLGIDDKGE